MKGRASCSILVHQCDEVIDDGEREQVTAMLRHAQPSSMPAYLWIAVRRACVRVTAPAPEMHADSLPTAGGRTLTFEARARAGPAVGRSQVIGSFSLTAATVHRSREPCVRSYECVCMYANRTRALLVVSSRPLPPLRCDDYHKTPMRGAQQLNPIRHGMRAAAALRWKSSPYFVHLA